MPNWIGSTSAPSMPRPPIWVIRCIDCPRAGKFRGSWLGSERIPVEDPDVLIGFFKGFRSLDGTLPLYLFDAFLLLGLEGTLVIRGHKEPMGLFQTKFPVALEDMVGGAQKLFHLQV